MFALNGFTFIRVHRISLNFVDEENAKNERTEIKNEIENKINFWIGRTISAIANKKTWGTRYFKNKNQHTIFQPKHPLS